MLMIHMVRYDTHDTLLAVTTNQCSIRSSGISVDVDEKSYYIHKLIFGVFRNQFVSKCKQYLLRLRLAHHRYIPRAD